MSVTQYERIANARAGGPDDDETECLLVELHVDKIDGDRVVACHSCDGTRHERLADNTKRWCRECNGRGLVPCYRCGGDNIDKGDCDV